MASEDTNAVTNAECWSLKALLMAPFTLFAAGKFLSPVKFMSFVGGASLVLLLLMLPSEASASDKKQYEFCLFSWSKPISGGGPLTFAGWASTRDEKNTNYWMGKVSIFGSLGSASQMNLEGTFPDELELPVVPLIPDRIDEMFDMTGTVTDPNCIVDGKMPVHLEVDLDWKEMQAHLTLKALPGAYWHGCCAGMCAEMTERMSFTIEENLSVPLECETEKP